MPEANSPPPARRWMTFSLRTLLLLMLLVAVYLGGRYGSRVVLPPRLEGTWQAQLPAGFKRPVTIKHLDGNRFLLQSGSSIFNGIYVWDDGQLTVTQPSDDRMVGLVWQWDGDVLRLVNEPQGTPTGSSYLGTELSRHTLSRKP